MKNEENKLTLTSIDLECFQAMENMSIRIYEYFNEFNEDKLQGYSGEAREKKVVKKHYWIDMLNGIYDISNDYVNVQWNIGAVDQLKVEIDI